MNSLVNIYEKEPKYLEMLSKIQNKTSPVEISGVYPLVDSSLIELLNRNINSNIIYVFSNEIKAKQFYDENKDIIKNLYYLPKREILLYDYLSETKENLYERIDVLKKIEDAKNNKKEKYIIALSIETLMQPMVNHDALFKNKIVLEQSKEASREDIREKLVKLEYEKTDIVEARGQFSIRGDIIDIGISDTIGIRVELWGDDVDSIRQFDTLSQRSLNTLDKITIYPNHEQILEKSLDNVVKEIKQKYGDINFKIDEIVKKDIEQILKNNYLSKIDKYFDEFYHSKETLLQYLPKDTIIINDEITKIKNRVAGIISSNENAQKALIEKNKITIESLEYENRVIEKLEEFKNIYFQREDTKLGIEDVLEINARVLNFSKEQISEFINFLKQNQEKYNINIVGQSSQLKQIKKLLEDQDILYAQKEKIELTKLSKQYVSLVPGDISSGLVDEDLKLILINGNTIFKKEKLKRVKSKEFNDAKKIVYADLRVGDVVVHENHGIGIFQGINRIKSGDVEKDYIKIKYRDDGILYVPTSQMDRVRKYIGAEESCVRLSSLSSKDWDRTKAKVKKNLRQIAKDLLELYAIRENSKGFAFSKDTVWQKEFEDKFEYEETQDQLRCIDEVKSDMEDSKPMDRLLCGDVGFGKTEIAIRAIFKAVQDSKQVAYVAPTTVLANQQYLNITERFKDYPIRVELLNRYKTKKEQLDIIRKLKTGQIDVVIGTHRLFSNDIGFLDLGLLVIDEEQRFGVKHKEKIKNFKKNVDVLTMSATPIPRTLHMSIVGIRDMSVIYSPPQDRKTVQTYVMEYDEDIIKEAITKELERGGQVFYLFNSVEQMENKVEFLQKLVPDAKIDFANGQMSGKTIESKMQDFIEKKTNLLVATTIIESGIDIPNANTLIVENADKMGLSQLYQIRGRVGRSSKQAYAYITYKKEKILSEDADKRLKALKEFTDFGSGYKIAMRDLEIRGAGSLVGEIQSGHLEEVGYDTYVKLLDQVLSELKGQKAIDDEQDVKIDIDQSSYIPDEYIKSQEQKIDIYQKIANSKCEEDISNIIDELIDRYGEPPYEVMNLIKISKIRYLSRNLNATKIISKSKFLIMNFQKDKPNIDIIYLANKYKDDIKFSNTDVPKITINLKTKNVLDEIIKILEDCIKQNKVNER